MSAKDLAKDVNRMHAGFRDFCEHFKQWYHDDNGVFDTTQMAGEEASERVAEYIKDHPDIVMVRCDDAHFTGSDLVLIPHPGMGSTMIYIPQCDASTRRFFLYPQDMQTLIDALSQHKQMAENGLD